MSRDIYVLTEHDPDTGNLERIVMAFQSMGAAFAAAKARFQVDWPGYEYTKSFGPRRARVASPRHAEPVYRIERVSFFTKAGTKKYQSKCKGL